MKQSKNVQLDTVKGISNSPGSTVYNLSFKEFFLVKIYDTVGVWTSWQYPARFGGKALRFTWK